jgi:hypothetical protein
MELATLMVHALLVNTVMNSRDALTELPDLLAQSPMVPATPMAPAQLDSTAMNLRDVLMVPLSRVTV